MLLGCIPDLSEHVDEDLRDRHVGRLIGGASDVVPAAIDHSHLYTATRQRGESCVGWAFSTSFFLLAMLAGRPIVRPSAKGIWDLARLVDGRNVLTNVGCRPRSALVGLQEYGMCAEARWPETADNLNDPPPLDVFKAGVGAEMSAYYRIGGGNVALLARLAIAKGFVPFMTMPVDDSFGEISDGTIYDGASGPRRGFHAMAVVGYGPGYFLLANSWGAEWGVRGVGRISDGVMNTLVSDVIVPTLAPAALS